MVKLFTRQTVIESLRKSEKPCGESIASTPDTHGGHSDGGPLFFHIVPAGLAARARAVANEPGHGRTLPNRHRRCSAHRFHTVYPSQHSKSHLPSRSGPAKQQQPDGASVEAHGISNGQTV